MGHVAGDKTEYAPPTVSRSPVDDVENPQASDVMSSVLQRWNRQNFLERNIWYLRMLCCFFSLISLVVMASNKHGDWRNFDQYQEYRYCLAIAILAFLYTLVQVALQIYKFNTSKELLSRRSLAILDFAGDQVTAYFLMSALSAAIPLTNHFREGANNSFTDSSSAAISMAFFAFTTIALSAVISGYKLCTQTYI